MIPLLEDISHAQRQSIVAADAVRLRIAEEAELWKLTFTTPSCTSFAETFFTIPRGFPRWEVVADRVFSILAAVELAPHTDWSEVRPGHLHGSVQPTA